MVVCHCNMVNDRTIYKLASSAGRALTVSDVTNHCGAGGDCGGCVDTIAEVLQARPNDSAQQH